MIFSTSCEKRKDNTIKNNILTFLVTCTGGSLDACNSGCAGKYPDVTGDNYPAASACFSACSTNCNLSTTLLLLTNK
ncbi:hypothetical protein EHQ16_18835 [Leptospira kanakyensis]|uniref:Uncharacterized protein n=1 Tax=Leptospira kanakyensis TaxID=2484968 RepID=A0A6N4QC58_9LEPT|nr:hypothetical protein EHQ11_07145 [Leptospira kanakyensis]TGK57972.1 hypothetical protein EHQ16_18835 [Leptospira kanakyensis]TGK73672.1 hypothetical protein EHQ18_07220 [Leptospira kanakyensis]